MKRIFGLALLLVFLTLSCKKTIKEDPIPFDPEIEELPINQIQTIGSHNSYRLRTDKDIFNAVKGITSILPDDLNSSAWDYTHIPIVDQLELGLRNFELDIYYDPAGGRYYNRMGNALVGRPVQSGINQLKEPGMKLLHIPDVDYNTHHYTFKEALVAMKKWSDKNPTHLPIIILVEDKDFGVGNILPFFTQILPFTPAAMNAIDQEIKDVFGDGSSQVFTPDNLRGGHPNVLTAIQTDGWPKVKDMRGKFIFCFYGNDNYLQGTPNLEGRMMFQFSQVNTGNAAFVKIDDSDNIDQIATALESGAFVRTRSDSSPNYAKNNITTSREKAFMSGAQIISTDYYIPDFRAGQPGWSDYQVIFPTNNYARVSVFDAPEELKGRALPE